MPSTRLLSQPVPAADEMRTASVQTLVGSVSLAELPLRQDAWVDALQMEGDAEQQALLLRLLEIGFLPGQPVRVVARAAGGGDPIAVRVGRSTFALRRGEAALVRVRRTATAEAA